MDLINASKVQKIISFEIVADVFFSQPDGLRLAEGRGFLAQKFNRRTNVEFRTSVATKPQRIELVEISALLLATPCW